LKTKRTILPGKMGTKKWVKKYGDKLVCVRYKYDDKTQKRLTTIELIVEEQNWKPNTGVIPKNKIVYIGIKYGEVELARKAKALGGKWNKQKRVWELAYGKVQALGIAKRIMD